MTDDTQDPKKPRKPAAKKTAPAKKQPAKKTPARKKTAARKGAPAKKTAQAKKPPVNDGTKKAPKGADTKASEAAMSAVSSLLTDAKRAFGRPTKYTDDIIPKMIAYFDIETERTEEEPLRDKEGNILLDKDGNPRLVKVKVVNKFPTLERFASKIGVTRETLHDWATQKLEDGRLRYPDFSYTYTRARELQSALLQEGGLEGAYESRIVQFALKNLAGWRDVIDTHVEGSVSQTSKEDLDAVYDKGIENSRRMAEAAKNRVLYGTVPGEVPLPPALAPSVAEQFDDEDEDGERDE